MKNSSAIRIKSKSFAINVIRFCENLDKHRMFVISNQLLRSGTSIGANVVEAQDGQSKADFIAKLSIALKEARETLYWLELVEETSPAFITHTEYLRKESTEIIAILTAILKTSRKNSKL